ncbi:hypothetical protein Pcinc_010066 [Petrolisthes cinctipes]|uniref:Uncharacterized protein n=1 Tax=Petrolisthes cinctipes TaxID=88211 RepID=A0AAE1G5Q7_PETCI|nr:hypothetical protein Pcinc_010066 [Petrolisthes cinctipes]
MGETIVLFFLFNYRI